MDYKKIIRSQRLRIEILQMLRWVPDSIMLRVQYRIQMGFWPDFKHPKRFTEKLQLYKMKYRNPIMHQCVDKYEVRKYVESKGLGHILNELYGVYDKVEDIDFNTLPNQFVIKSTTGGGGFNVIVVRDKNTADFNDIRHKISSWNIHKPGQVSAGREWAYSGMPHTRIIIEKYLENPSKNELIDYKFFCFEGKPYCVQVDTGRYTGHHQNYYDMQWNSLGVHCSYPEGEQLEMPSQFTLMKEVVSKLSEDFPFVRVDLYDVNGKVYFGELTFYPSSGYGKFHPDNFDMTLGNKLGDHVK